MKYTIGYCNKQEEERSFTLLDNIEHDCILFHTCVKPDGHDKTKDHQHMCECEFKWVG